MPRWTRTDWYPETWKAEGFLAPFCRGRGVDLGCGPYKIVPDAIGIDGDLDRAADRKWNFEAGFPPDSDLRDLDYVYSSHCLEHLKEPGKRLREWWDALRVGGMLVLYLPNPEWTGWNHGIPVDDFRKMTEGLTSDLALWGYHNEPHPECPPMRSYSYIFIARKAG